jgi:3-hydroxyisobutyrate dehydrogenase-like beta-hydroxyacid dehydrogenase
MSALKVGFVGLGDQGSPMAEAISEASYDLHVWARRTQSYHALDRVNYHRHDSLECLAAVVDVLSLCLRDDKDVWELIRDGRLKALRPGVIVVNHGTGDPTENEHIAAFLGESGINFLDAPVSGGRPGALARTLTTFVGGDAEHFERCRPLFDAFSRKVARMGGVGSGQLTKLLNNAMTMTNLKNAVDVFTFARKLGLDIPRFYDAITASSGSSAVLQSIGTQIDSRAAVHIQSLMCKDIEHFMDAMRARSLDANAVRERGLSGADGVIELTKWIEGTTTPDESDQMTRAKRPLTESKRIHR